jgi:hypothetical protein
MSSKDIRGGERSIRILSGILESCNYGICFIDDENVRSPWISFEAGAISKNVNASRLVVLLQNDKCINLLSDTPLHDFEYKFVTKDEIKNLIDEIADRYGMEKSKKNILKRLDDGWNNFEKEYSIAYSSETSDKSDESSNESDDIETIKKMLINIQNLLNTDYAQSIKDGLSMTNELRGLVSSLKPENLDAFKQQIKVHKYETAIMDILSGIKELIDNMEDENGDQVSCNVDQIKEKLNEVLEIVYSLLD